MFPHFLQLLTTVKRSFSHLFNSLRVPFFLFFFLFCFKISWVFFPKTPKLLFIQPIKFLPQKQIKTEPMIFQHIQWDCQNFAHILNYLIAQPLVPEYLPQQNPQSPTPGWNSQNIRLPCQTQKKICLLVALPQWRDYSRQFRLIRSRRGLRRHLCPRIVGINKLPQKPGLIPPAPKISIS